jgi:hypothetical protein
MVLPIPPALIVIRIGTWIWLPLPVILLWPFALVLAVLVMLVVAPAAAARAGWAPRRPWAVLWQLLMIAAALRGLHVDVASRKDGHRFLLSVVA